MKNILLIFIGGGLGSIVRYYISKQIQALIPNFPFGTLMVNVLASFLLGVLIGKWIENDTVRLFFIVGFCGGFSTFSTFSNDTLQLIQTQRLAEALLNIALNTIICLIATWGGFQLTLNH